MGYGEGGRRMSVSASTAAAKGPTRLALIAYATALVAVGLDQLTKFWVVSVLDLPDRFSISVLPFFSLTLVWNNGVSFNLLAAHSALGRWGLVVFSIAVALGLAAWAWRSTRLLLALSAGLIMGGALGNALDRARIGRVVDFLDFSGTHVFPWIFNVADSAINVGVALLILDSLLTSKKE